jgi:prevent-host-death family protein
MRIERVGLFRAKTHLSELVEAVRKGRSFIITRRGKPVAELKPVQESAPGTWLNLYRGRIRMSEDFDAPLEGFKDYLA